MKSNEGTKRNREQKGAKLTQKKKSKENQGKMKKNKIR